MRKSQLVLFAAGTVVTTTIFVSLQIAKMAPPIPGLGKLLDPTIVMVAPYKVPGPPSLVRDHTPFPNNSSDTFVKIHKSRKAPSTPYAAIHPNHLTEIYPTDTLEQISQRIQVRYNNHIMNRVSAPTVTSIDVENIMFIYPTGYYKNIKPVTVYARRFTLNSTETIKYGAPYYCKILYFIKNCKIDRKIVGYYVNYDKINNYDNSVIFQINGHFGSNPSRLNLGLDENGGYTGAALGKLAMYGYPMIFYDDHNIGESSKDVPDSLPRTLENIVQIDQAILQNFDHVDVMGLSGGTERLYHYMMFNEAKVRSAYFASFFNPPWTQFDSVNAPNDTRFGVNLDTYDDIFNRNFLYTDLALVGINKGVLTSFIHSTFDGGAGKYGFFEEMQPIMQLYTSDYHLSGDDIDGDGLPDYPRPRSRIQSGLDHEYNLPDFIHWIEKVRTIPAHSEFSF
jgi:hypothetical protein